MKKIWLSLLALPLFYPMLAAASCYRKDAEPLFSCTMQGNGKHLEICAIPNEGIEYSFGHSITSPELNFRLSRQKAYYEFIQGGHWADITLYLPRGNVTYELRHFFSTKAPEINELTVYINHKAKAVLKCRSNSVNNNMDEDLLFSVAREANEYDQP